MRKIIAISAIAVLCVVLFTMHSQAAKQVSISNAQEKNILVEIDYGNIFPSRKIEVPFIKDRTILEVLQTVAKVETHPVGEYVIVTAIDGVEGKRGQMAWYYKVDGKSPDKIAYANVVNDARYISWMYQEDVCSGKIDSENKVNVNN
ncbi:MAG: DUF4430 domain-containing protein [Candidatus Omnitrophica bacterium]|nr:DUF4430 domain-containing protein [Candidatus Omnitrophota bacterium]